MLAQWLGVDGRAISQREPRSQAAVAVVEIGKHVFVVETKSSGGAAAVSRAAEQVRTFAGSENKKTIPIVVVLYMGEVGRSVVSRRASSGWTFLETLIS